MLCAQIGQRISKSRNSAGQGRRRLTAGRRSSQKINCDEAFRTSARLTEDVNFIFADEETDTASERVCDIVTDRSKLIELHDPEFTALASGVEYQDRLISQPSRCPPQEQRRFFANALPEPDLKYRSSSLACLSVGTAT